MRYEANATTGEVIQREMTAEEIAQDLADQAAAAEREEAETQKSADKAALLARMGLTEDEARLLLG